MLNRTQGARISTAMWLSDQILDAQERRQRARWDEIRRKRKARKRRSANSGRQRRPSVVDRLRQTEAYKSWSSLVIMSAAGKCADCNATSKKLEAIHVTPVLELCKRYHAYSLREAKQIRELWESGSGVALCRRCLYRKIMGDAEVYGWRLERVKQWFHRRYGPITTSTPETSTQDNRLESLEEWQKFNNPL